jgi:hypothetical protein
MAGDVPMNGRCPGCGRCQHCGHTPQITYPYQGPIWIAPQFTTPWREWQVTCGDPIGTTTSATTIIGHDN